MRSTEPASPELPPSGGPARRRKALWAMLAVTVIWGWTFVWMKQASAAGDRWLAAFEPTRAGPLCVVAWFMALRFGIAALLLAAFVPASRRRLSAAAWRGGLALGGLLLAGFLLQMLALNSVTASVSAFLTSLYVLFTAAITTAIERRPPAARLLAGAVLATAGAAYIGGPPQVAFGVGEWLTVASAAVFAVHIVLTDRVTKRVDPLAVTLTSFVVVAAGSAAVLAGCWRFGRVPGPAFALDLLAQPGFAWPLAASCVFATVLAITWMNLFQRELDPVRAAIIYAIEPVWASGIAILGGMEQPTLWLWLGGGALLLGNWVAEAGPAPSDASSSPR